MMDVAIEYGERGSPRDVRFRPSKIDKANVIDFYDKRRLNRRRYQMLRSAVIRVLQTDSELYFKLADYAEGIYQFFSHDELEILQKVGLFDERNKIDELAIAAIRDASDPKRR